MVSFFGDGIRFVPKSENARHEIKVVGVGGGGGNTVNHMFRKGGVAVDYAVCNTDKQALSASPVPSAMPAPVKAARHTGGVKSAMMPK